MTVAALTAGTGSQPAFPDLTRRPSGDGPGLDTVVIERPAHALPAASPPAMVDSARQ